VIILAFNRHFKDLRRPFTKSKGAKPSGAGAEHLDRQVSPGLTTGITSPWRDRRDRKNGRFTANRLCAKSRLSSGCVAMRQCSRYSHAGRCRRSRAVSLMRCTMELLRSNSREMAREVNEPSTRRSASSVRAEGGRRLTSRCSCLDWIASFLGFAGKSFSRSFPSGSRRARRCPSGPAAWASLGQLIGSTFCSTTTHRD